MMKNRYRLFHRGRGTFYCEDLKGELLDMGAEFGISDEESFGFLINDFLVSYNKNENMLSCGGEKAKLAPVDNRIRLRILVDRMSVEVFVNTAPEIVTLINL
jgi:sucrose-6-phosphate hydrolase SacC (GH32 family)